MNGGGAHERLLALVGDPVAHSLSPTLHRALIDEFSLNYRYLAFRVRPHGLEDAVRGLRALGAAGFNVTVPHKRAVLPLLDALSPDAEALGAANTVVIEGGRLIGHNTDWIGFLRPLGGADLYGQSAVLLGAGGAASAAAYALIQAGVARVTVANRTREKAEALKQQIEARLGFAAVETCGLNEAKFNRSLEDATLLVHATPVGMWPEVETSPVSADALHADLIVYDLVYNPLETRLLREAKAAGATALGGLDMLVGQGTAAFELWTGASVSDELSGELNQRLGALIA